MTEQNGVGTGVWLRRKGGRARLRARVLCKVKHVENIGRKESLRRLIITKLITQIPKMHLCQKSCNFEDFMRHCVTFGRQNIANFIT